MKYVLTPLALAASLALGWLTYRSSLEHVERRTAKPPPEPIAVQVTRVSTKEIEERVEFVGSLEANATVEIRSRISGYITRLPFEVGDFVESKKLVVELDRSEHEEAVRQAEAALKVAQAQLLAQQTKQTLAETEVERQVELAKSGVSTAQQQEQAQAQLAIAKAEVELEQARVAQAHSKLLASKLSLDETAVLAPLSGYVAERFVEVGDLADPKLLLLRIIDLTKVRTVIHVVEKDYGKVKRGQPATIRIDAFPGQSFSGKVVRKSPILDPETQTAAVHIDIPNPKAHLKPGMHARVSILFSKRKKADVVPIASLIEYDDKPALYVVTGDPPTTSLHEVRTGIRDGALVEIVAGVKLNDRVVTLGSRIVQHGQPVTPIEVELPQTLEDEPFPHSNSTNAAE